MYNFSGKTNYEKMMEIRCDSQGLDKTYQGSGHQTLEVEGFLEERAKEKGFTPKKFDLQAIIYNQALVSRQKAIENRHFKVNQALNEVLKK